MMVCVSVEFILVIILILLLVYKFDLCNYETYASKPEKAAAINTWFKQNPNPSYAKYKKEVDQSDIIEYTKFKNTSIDNIAKNLI